jgi:hypothetical protein
MKEHKDDAQKDEKCGDLLKLRTNSVHSVKTIVLACTRKISPIVNFGPHAEPAIVSNSSVASSLG